MARKLLITLFIVVLTIPLSSLVVAAAPSVIGASDELAVTRVDSILEAKPSNPAVTKTPPTIEIIAPIDGTTVKDIFLIKAIATDTDGIKKVEYAIDGGAWVVMSGVGGDVYEASWDSLSVADGSHEITVRATDKVNAKTEASVSITTQNGGDTDPVVVAYKLTVEIDYIEGHTPTQAVLDYIDDYYNDGNPSGDKIDVTFTLGDKIALIGNNWNATDGISTSEFWSLEAANNGGYDNAGGNPNSGEYYTNDKWVLYGTSVEGSTNTVGYCYTAGTNTDLLAGNYIFIADGRMDQWEEDNGVLNSGAEAVVLMHELGHSIGIAVLDRAGREVYDPVRSSVMSYLRIDNATQYNAWYYSDKYWTTRNLGYYVV